MADWTEQHAQQQHHMGEALQHYQHFGRQQDIREALQRDGGSLLFLGTGCAEPSKYRSSSGVHLRLHGGRGVLIDAGEGVHGQLVRHYGQALAQEQVACRLLAISWENLRVVPGDKAVYGYLLRWYACGVRNCLQRPSEMCASRDIE